MTTHRCQRCPAMIMTGFVCRDCVDRAVAAAPPPSWNLRVPAPRPEAIIHVVPLADPSKYGAVLVQDGLIVDDDGPSGSKSADEVMRAAWLLWGAGTAVLIFPRSVGR